jgi:hypothetical protein
MGPGCPSFWLHGTQGAVACCLHTHRDTYAPLYAYDHAHSRAPLTCPTQAFHSLLQAACCAVKRINLDVRVAKNAARAGAALKENFEVRPHCTASRVRNHE